MASFAQLTDLHLRPPGVLTLGRIDADHHTVQAIDAVNVRHPDIDAVLVTGDIADLGEDDAYARAAMLLSRFAAPVIVIPGNHDRTAALQDAFSAFPGHAGSPVAAKACQVATIAGVLVIALDTAVGDGIAHGGMLGAEQLAWLDDTLGHSSGPALIAMHHPPFDVGIGFMDAIGLSDAAGFARVLSRHENVIRIVCGHVHRTIVGEVSGVPVIAVPGVAHQVRLALDPDMPAAMVMEPPAYAIHTVLSGKAVSHVAYVDEFGGAIHFARPADTDKNRNTDTDSEA